MTGWSDTYQQSYAVYTTEDGGRYFLWYQDGASVEAAMRAAKLLGVTGMSLWRLGSLPDSTVMELGQPDGIVHIVEKTADGHLHQPSFCVFFFDFLTCDKGFAFAAIRRDSLSIWV